eukprot:CAMPEP_0172749870 /NCGR_PEP_ID=MMETSP1074-20121228/148372_1 /TAXON_ID=2916 /ORGANISM="Ceratium fusus, Strain PA161109" /LENGTH=397 /DNA_ID=CAMNT_0013581909 /DNA_START=257 /DNA_END=1447 /DNA_ORIENTATION=+
MWKAEAPAKPEVIRDFFQASYAVRRRPQNVAWQFAPVASLFKTEQEHLRSSNEAILREAYIRLLDAGADPKTAFRLLDEDGNDKIRPCDLGTPQAMNLGLPPHLLCQLFGTLARGADGNVSKKDWLTAFNMHDDRRHTLVDDIVKPPEAVPLPILRRIKIEQVNHTAYLPIWNSEHMMCHNNVSIWAPDQLVCGLIRVTAKRLCFGHYANKDFADARGGGTAGVKSRQILQVRDTGWGATGKDEYLLAAADHYCPCPIEFRQVWQQQRGQPVFIWRPVPPNDTFVALGMVATTTPEPPLVDSVRCVPKSFCRKVKEEPVHLWDDVGGGGKPASFWLVNSMQMLWTVVGHGVPQETFWDLDTNSISFDSNGHPSVHITHERQRASALGSGVLPRRTSW